MAKGKRKGKGKKHYGRKIKKKLNKAKAKTFRMLKAIALEGPLIFYVADGVMNVQGFQNKIKVFASRLCAGTTGILLPGMGAESFGFGGGPWNAKYLILGWGGPLAYKGIQFAVNVIPGKKDSPFAELSAITG